MAPPVFSHLCSKSRNLLSQLYKWPPQFFRPWPPPDFLTCLRPCVCMFLFLFLQISKGEQTPSRSGSFLRIKRIKNWNRDSRNPTGLEPSQEFLLYFKIQIDLNFMCTTFHQSGTLPQSIVSFLLFLCFLVSFCFFVSIVVS